MQNCGSPNDQGPTRDDILGIFLGSQSGEMGDGGDGGRGMDGDGSWVEVGVFAKISDGPGQGQG